MGRIKIGSPKYGDVRKAFKNGTAAKSEEGRQTRVEYLEEAITGNITLKLRASVMDSDLQIQILGPATSHTSSVT